MANQGVGLGCILVPAPLVIPHEKQVRPKHLQEITAIIHIVLNRFHLVAAPLAAGAKWGCVKCVTQMDHLVRVVVIPEIDYSL